MSKLHEDWTKNVSSRLFTCFHYIHINKTAPPPGGHVFPLITTIFKLVRNIHITNAKHVTSRVKKTPPSLVAMFFLPIQTIFELNFTAYRVRFGSRTFAANRAFNSERSRPFANYSERSLAVSFAYASEPVTGRLGVM
ncbi:hypothetical protein DPMN_177759 [Dreissena polymorpha]|uniref:Uncharacterized protein n=1 Tax=Dreissena polymorpha TaxID=45954 RepID=A0A9D4E9L2_DREPO|nr:hypothetical protein DPMN_177759 [Dreissena polymorpha]